MKTIYIGLDVGSTTLKGVVTDEAGEVLFSDYARHGARIREKLLSFLHRLYEQFGDASVSITMTGSIGMGVAEHYELPFLQEVVCAARYMKHYYPSITTMVDIGGEDAKVVFFREGQSPDLRMNGNCAGGTGSFIDQMAILLNVSVDELNQLALQAHRIYPIASRCGVFCKTDIQNLLAKNVDRTDIAASIFHAVAVQTVVTLSHGQDITAPLLFCGGPLTFIPALRKAFVDYLHLSEDEVIVPERGELIPAWGAALSAHSLSERESLSSLVERIGRKSVTTYTGSQHLKALFRDETELEQWQQEKLRYRLPVAELRAGRQEVVIGIDSGSTTTKIVALNAEGRAVFTFYSPNNGDPIGTVARGLTQLQEEATVAGAELCVTGSCSTGYGEDLIREAFCLGDGIVETIAHYRAACHMVPDVSFILDIGGQDMKAIFVEQGVINRIEINEACSSGCGTFIETFAKSMNYGVADFARRACLGELPCDLGTRCTVFMNSKVKQVLREGATIGDIAAGLSYSVINNCLYKVLKIKQLSELGRRVVVQGGTMHNDSVVRALELLIDAPVCRSDCPELMGAYGCALYARSGRRQHLTLPEMLGNAAYTTRELHCSGCENHCYVNRYTFRNGASFFSGNKCERVFTNRGEQQTKGVNLYEKRRRLLFDRTQPQPAAGALRIGIPRALGMYEDYPFWHTLFSRVGCEVVLSDASVYSCYESGVKSVMADNICFPAKLLHSHILDLEQKQVDRIFMPYVVFETPEGGQNSFNCPIVSGYSDVIRSSMSPDTPIDSPVITFKDLKALKKEVTAYLRTLGIDRKRSQEALAAALQAQKEFKEARKQANDEVREAGKKAGRLLILLAGRPYHTDPLVQHKLAEMVTALGADCLTVDGVRGDDIRQVEVHYMSQWAYPQLILKAAQWVAEQGDEVQMVQLTSFGCGPDAFLLDEVRSLLHRHHKVFTQLKIDDVTNIGSLKLRVRSVVDSLRMQLSRSTETAAYPDSFVTTPAYTEEMRRQHSKIIVPYFTDFITPLVPSFLAVAGYDAEVLPLSDEASGEWGLKYANNEICYPATLVVGDIVKAFKSGRYDPDTTTALITQTGGQCRASNYISLIKKALVEAGYGQVPVVSLTLSSMMQNEQPAFKLPLKRIIPIALTTILYTDAISKMYYASVPREKSKGAAEELRDKYLEVARDAVKSCRSKQWVAFLRSAATDFDAICGDRDCPLVGIVGESFVQFTGSAQRGVTQGFVDNGIEVEPPVLCDFFLQSFVNQDENFRTGIESGKLPYLLMRGFYRLVKHRIEEVNTACRSFRYFRPFDDVYELAERAKDFVSLSAQFGEGWLLPGEVATMVHHGITHVVSLQPFGCIANHIISKGIETRLRKLFPQLCYLSLDFDSGVSDVNVTNRLLLFANDLLEELKSRKHGC